MKNNLGCEDAALEASVNTVFYLHLSQLFNAESIDFWRKLMNNLVEDIMQQGPVWLYWGSSQN